jgi:hypothetical protein
MKKSIKVCDLETVVLPAGVEGSTKLATAAAVIVIIGIALYKKAK